MGAEFFSAFSCRLSVLQDHYRTLAQREKLDKESKRFVGRKLSYMQLSDKYGLTAAVARRRVGFSPIAAGLSGSSFGSPGVDVAKQAEPSPAEAVDISEVEVLPEDLFEKEVDLCSVTSLDQRLLNLDLQPEAMVTVFPHHKHLMIKRSQRCRKCEHNLSKPEYNPSSIKFKIQLAAFYHIPEVVVFAVEGEVKAGAEVKFVLKVSNPTQHATRVRFLPREDYDKDRQMRKCKEEEETAAVDSGTSVGSGKQQDLRKKLSTGILRNSTSLVTASDLHHVDTNTVFVPSSASTGVFVPPRDDAAEFDDSSSGGAAGLAPDDNRDLVRWRRANKVGVVLRAHVDERAMVGEKAVVELTMSFVYTNTISALEQKEVQTAEIFVPLYIVLGETK